MATFYFYDGGVGGYALDDPDNWWADEAGTVPALGQPGFGTLYPDSDQDVVIDAYYPQMGGQSSYAWNNVILGTPESVGVSPFSGIALNATTIVCYAFPDFEHPSFLTATDSIEFYGGDWGAGSTYDAPEISFYNASYSFSTVQNTGGDVSVYVENATLEDFTQVGGTLVVKGDSSSLGTVWTTGNWEHLSLTGVLVHNFSAKWYSGFSVGDNCLIYDLSRKVNYITYDGSNIRILCYSRTLPSGLTRPWANVYFHVQLPNYDAPLELLDVGFNSRILSNL